MSRSRYVAYKPGGGTSEPSAGLWERWNDPQGKAVETCTILTTQANELMRPLHDRMPVLIVTEVDGLWLDPHASADVLRSLLVLSPAEWLEAIPVGPWVSKARNEGPMCLEPAGE